MKNKRDPIKLICDVGELSGLFTDSTSLETFLQKTVEMVAHHMDSDVCSIYLFHEETQELVLKATMGLNLDFIGNVRLKLTEGLTGLAVKELRPVCERNASKNKNFRYFPGLGEEQFESFLVMPIMRGTIRIGAMVIQNTAKDFFVEEDVKVLRALTSQLANTIEMTRLIFSFGEKPVVHLKPVVDTDFKFVKGKIGSIGVALGEVTIVDYDKTIMTYDNIQADDKKYTLDNFYIALKDAEVQLEVLQQQIEEKLSDVASLIFAAQILMLKDKGFVDAMVCYINDGVNPPDAISRVVAEYVYKFKAISNAYLREKSQDIQDVGRRLFNNLTHKGHVVSEYENCIVIAQELFPSDVLKFSSQKVKGIILLSGGVTGHVAILAQSLKIPLIIVDEPRLLSLALKTKILMDANIGNLYIRPSKDILKSFQNKERASISIKEEHKTVTPQTYTQDGQRITLMANINLIGDLETARAVKAHGIGLYRTEFPFIVRNNFPSEEEQYVIYKKVIEGMPKKVITFRTLDIGGDKVLSYFDSHHKESNPFLGMRSIRFSLRHKDIFMQQIRAILRAGVEAEIRIMFPMISSVDEFLEAKDVVLTCSRNLEKEGVAYSKDVKIGLMIELPSIVALIDDVAKEADFLSVGTNDLIQYMLAVDRTNEKVADLYLPHHPSVLKALKRVAQAAQNQNIEVSICGDMVHEQKYLTFLLGIGIKTFSLNPAYLPRIQKAIQRIDQKLAKKEADVILTKNRLGDMKIIFVDK